MDLEPGFEAARARMREQLTYDVKRRIGGDAQRITAMDVRHEAVTFKLLLLPVWMLAYRYGGGAAPGARQRRHRPGDGRAAVLLDQDHPGGARRA